jgi:hypothetical protein
MCANDQDYYKYYRGLCADTPVYNLWNPELVSKFPLTFYEGHLEFFRGSWNSFHAFRCRLYFFVTLNGESYVNLLCPVMSL